MRPWVSKKATISYFLCFFALLTRETVAQTSCATQHPQTGAFICFPDPASDGKASQIHTNFHLSAQGNAAEGQKISHYAVRMDGRLIYENRLYADLTHLSIETNLKAPFDVGSHKLSLVIDGAGVAEVKDVNVSAPEYISFCNPFTRFDGRVCIMDGSPRSLEWPRGRVSPIKNFDSFLSYAKLYEHNLKSIEADTADAMAVDSQGRLFVASHAFNEVELREYSGNGSIVYDSIMHSCSEGYVSVEGLAIDSHGLAWIAGNTNACLITGPESVPTEVRRGSKMRGFVTAMDTTKPGATPPLVVKYLNNEESRVTGIRLDEDGNAYISGVTTSSQFPHDSVLKIGAPVADTSQESGFILMMQAKLYAPGWSDLLPGTLPTALALDGEGNVLLTGQIIQSRSFGPAFVAELSEHGRRVSYAAQISGVRNAEGRSIAVGARGSLLVVGEAEDPNQKAQPFIASVQPCRSGAGYWRGSGSIEDVVPMMAVKPALDSFASSLATGNNVRVADSGTALKTTVLIAPHCSGARFD